MNAVTAPVLPTVDAGAAGEDTSPPIVAAVDGSPASRAAVREAVRLGLELDARIVFVHVRRGPTGLLGAPFFQRRLSRGMALARRVLDGAVAVAAGAGVRADAEILEGSPTQRIPEFARDRDARLVVVGSRRFRLGPSVSSGIVRAGRKPVLVATAPEWPAATAEAA